MNDCIFCKIVRGEIPSKKIYENSEILVFEDIYPKAPVHVLAIPKKHIASLSGVSLKDKNLLGGLQLKLAEIIKEKGIEDNFRVITFGGKKAGQTVFHLHYHLRGGWKTKAPEDI